jgi:hypothetical protein
MNRRSGAIPGQRAAAGRTVAALAGARGSRYLRTSRWATKTEPPSQYPSRPNPKDIARRSACSPRSECGYLRSSSDIAFNAFAMFSRAA